MLTLQQVADELGLSIETIRKFVKEGEFHPVDVSRTKVRRHLRFNIADVRAFKKRRALARSARRNPPK